MRELPTIGRRAMLRRSLAAVGAGVAAKASAVTGFLAAGRAARAEPSGRRFLVLVRAGGGNDGLNTVIPYEETAYLDARPTLRVTDGLLVLPDRQSLALHPRLAKLSQHYAAGRVAIVMNAGYDPPSLSHFRSEVIWQSADPVTMNPTGWIGRYLDTLAPVGDSEIRGFNVSWGMDHVFLADHANVFAFQGTAGVYFPTDSGGDGWWDMESKRRVFETISLEPRAHSAAAAIAHGGYVLSRNVERFSQVGAVPLATDFPTEERLSSSLAETARMIRAARAGDIEVGVFQASIGGFDHHSNQEAGDESHSNLLGRVDAALDAFHAELVAQGAADEVLVLVYSEFGRRVDENASEGTDHGTSAPVIVFGNPVAGGVLGGDPDFAHVDDDGNLPFEHDFRRVYATILEDWLGADSAQILGAPFTKLPLLRA